MTARASARLSGQDLIYQDVPPALAEQARRNARDQSDTPGHVSWPLDAWPPVPTRFVLCTEDRFSPPLQRKGPDPDPFVAQDDDGACAQVLCHLIKVGPDDGRLLSRTAGR